MKLALHFFGNGSSNSLQAALLTWADFHPQFPVTGNESFPHTHYWHSAVNAAMETNVSTCPRAWTISPPDEFSGTYINENNTRTSTKFTVKGTFRVGSGLIPSRWVTGDNDEYIQSGTVLRGYPFWTWSLWATKAWLLIVLGKNPGQPRSRAQFKIV